MRDLWLILVTLGSVCGLVIAVILLIEIVRDAVRARRLALRDKWIAEQDKYLQTEDFRP